jgi:hypothetical protein
VELIDPSQQDKAYGSWCAHSLCGGILVNSECSCTLAMLTFTCELLFVMFRSLSARAVGVAPAQSVLCASLTTAQPTMLYVFVFCCLLLLQIPIQALGRASRSLASTSRSLGGSGNSTGGKLAYADFKMPAYAMRNLSTSSKLPQLQKGSVGAGSRSSQPGISTLSASTQSTDKGQVWLLLCPGKGWVGGRKLTMLLDCRGGGVEC